jgi:DNA segregation ATPase FtsK/SpoIIIE, S-DNA-T family
MNEIDRFVSVWQNQLYGLLTKKSIVYRQLRAVRGTQVFSFSLRLSDSADLKKLTSLNDVLALEFGVDTVRVARSFGLVNVELSLPKYFRRNLNLWNLVNGNNKRGSWLTIGQTHTGVPVSVDFAGTNTCHTLISGITGSGKTVTQQSIAWMLAFQNDPDDMRLLVIDAKGSVLWHGFDRVPHLIHPVIEDSGEALAALNWALVELDRRGKARRDTPITFIVIDELKNLIDQIGEPVEIALSRLTAIGRELGIHVIAATQYPKSSAVGGSLAKANFPLRLAGRVNDSKEAYVATGKPESGAESLLGKGDFLVCWTDVFRMQIGRLLERDWGRLPRAEVGQSIEFESLDTERILDVSSEAPGPGRPPDDFDMDNLAFALINDRGINWLSEQLSIGQTKATRVREFSSSLRLALKARGYNVYPISEDMHYTPDLVA